MSTITTEAEVFSYAALEQTWPEFEAKILAFLDQLGLADKALHCDHVALRVNSIAAADALKQAFSARGRIISDNQINGRTILIIELDKHLTLGCFSIDCVELPYPGDTLYPQEGWEHIELVLPSNAKDCDGLSQELAQLSPSLAPLLQGQTALLSELPIKVKFSSPKGDKERLANPTIAFKQADICIKIHPHSIKAVIASEQD